MNKQAVSCAQLGSAIVGRVRRLRESKDEGSALVEMGFMLPLMMLVMTGIFSFSLLLFQQIQLSEAVSNAGRYLAVARLATDPCATAISALNNTPALVSSNMTITLSQNGTALGTSCPSTGTGLIQNATVNVTVTYTSSLAIYWKGHSTFTLNSQVSEIVQ